MMAWLTENIGELSSTKYYKYVGAEFGEERDRILAVVAISQSNLELIPTKGNSIATSTSHLLSSSLLNSSKK
jgi:hypothetical protein